MNRLLCHHEYGTPENVVKLSEGEFPTMGHDEILIKTTMAPINPADLNIIEGRYGDQPPLPVTLGNEGVGIIEKIGADVTELSIGDQVITPTLRGTWSEYRSCKAEEAVRVPHDIPPEVACMLTVNPLTAILMLESFHELKPEEYVLQNAANSGVGRAVIDIAKRMGIKTINIVRTHEQVEEVEKIGGSIQLTFDDLKAKRYPSNLRKLSIPLALNAVGGESARLITRLLSHGGTMVTYGAMSKEPVILDNGPLIYKNISIKGFWRSEWVRRVDFELVKSMMERLILLAEHGAFVVPIEKIYPFSDAAEALKHAKRSGRAGKILLSPRS
ncbi:MAG: 2-enoyl thioester reductase domain-containing protein [Chlamydiota bacterium]